MASRTSGEKIGIIGSGLIGRSWAMIFASAGYDVTLYDIEPRQLQNALQDIKTQLTNLEKSGMLRGKLNSQEQFQKISTTTSLQDCITNAIYTQECIPENLDMKKKMFEEIDKHAGDKTILASSTSCILPSKFTASLKHRQNTIVVHPVNPPYYVPMVELVPAPWTSPETVLKTKKLMQEIGQAPVMLKKEIDGFILNRIQYAILSEVWRLIEDDVANVEDIDTVMSEGLGMRYAFLGPLETAHLNAEGIKEYMDKYSNGIYNISSAFGPAPNMKNSAKLPDVTKELSDKVPVDKLQERRAWRDKRIAALSKLKKEMNSADSSK